MEISVPEVITQLVDNKPLSYHDTIKKIKNGKEEQTNTAGIYCFWWMDDTIKFNVDGEDENEDWLNTEVLVQGPQISESETKIYGNCSYEPNPTLSKKKKYHRMYKANLKTESNRRCIKTEGRIPLYIGKSTNIRKRLSNHIMPNIASFDKNGSERFLPFTSYEKGNEPTIVQKRKNNTLCQFRAGMEYLFRGYEVDVRDIILNSGKVKISFVKIEGERLSEDYKYHAFGERFYLEDFAIGLLRPPFNLDSER